MTMTRLLCTIIVITAAIYDLVAVQIGGVDISISRWFQTVGFAAPFQIFVLGYLAGHFFGFMKFPYKLYRVETSEGKMYYVITGSKPLVASVMKATKTKSAPTIVEINNPIIL